MARIRSTHPAQWTDEEFVCCSPLARLLILGLRNEADDNGIFEWKPLVLKMRLLPADSCDPEDLLEEALDHKQVRKFCIGRRSYGMIRNFVRYQKPKYPKFYFPVPVEAVLDSEEGFELHPKFLAENEPEQEFNSLNSPNTSGIERAEVHQFRKDFRNSDSDGVGDGEGVGVGEEEGSGESPPITDPRKFRPATEPPSDVVRNGQDRAVYIAARKSKTDPAMVVYWPRTGQVEELSKIYPDVDVIAVICELANKVRTGAQKPYTKRGMASAIAQWAGNAAKWGQHSLKEQNKKKAAMQVGTHTGEEPWHPDDVRRFFAEKQHPQWEEYMDMCMALTPDEWPAPRFEEWLKRRKSA